jgi:antitoxin component of MazEF toxin-antitoxin module
MRQFLEKIGEVRELIALKVCKSGDSLCVHIPAKTVNMHDIRPGDVIKVKLGDLFREKEG